jgi:hypothetical protein
MLRRELPAGVRRSRVSEKLKSRRRRSLEAPVLDAGAGEAESLEEVGQASEGDEAGVVGKGRDPGEQSAVGAIGGGDPRLGGRKVNRQVGVGTEVGLPDDGCQGTSLVGEAAEDQGLGCEEEGLGVVGAIGGCGPRNRSGNP